MAFSMQLFCVLFILMCVLLFFSVQGRMSVVFSVLFAVLLLVPTDAMGIISGTSYNTPGKFNISLEGYAVIFAFLIVVVIKRGTLRVKSRKIVLTILFALMLMFSIRILADGGGAASNKMLDGYLLPAIFAVLLLGYLDAHSLPKVLKTIYVCILISAVVACIEFVIGKSLFFHGYYMANIKWYKNVYDSTAWGVMFRTTALLGHPLVGGIYYVLALVYFLNTRAKGRWITSAAQAIVLALAIFSTNSRGVILCAIGYILYYLLKQKKYFILSMIAFAGLIALPFIDFSSLYTMIFSRDVSGGSVSVRVRALESILSIPGSVVLKGTGYNNTSGLLNSLGLSRNFELSFLIVFVENGLIGFVAWLVSLITLYDKRMLKEIDGMKVKSMLNGMIVCFLAVSSTSNSFGDPGTLNYILWALLAFTRVASTETNNWTQERKNGYIMGIIWHIKNAGQKFKYRRLHIGAGSRINLGVSINIPENVFIGDNTYINGGILPVGHDSKIVIGNDCLLSYNIHLRTMTHNYSRRDTLIREQGGYEKDIIIEDDVWIGYGVQIMPGVTVHRGAVVGTGAVVTHDVESYAVVGGVPARMIKYRE